MRRWELPALMTLPFMIVGCQIERSETKPPVAKVEPKRLESHGELRTDDYFWLRGPEKPEVIAYLKAEAEYAEAAMAHTKALQETLFGEFKNRIKQNDETAPYRKDGYFYYSRTEEGKEYFTYCRRKGSLNAAEQVMLDVNLVAEGHDFCSVHEPEVSPNTKLMVYAVDTVGRRFYDLRFRNLETGEDLDDVIPQVAGNVVWANDNKIVLYVRQHPETLRWYQIYRHVLGTEPANDVLVYEEADETFECDLDRSRSGRYILLAITQTVTTEYRYIDANKPSGEFQVVEPRRRNHEYDVDHFAGSFYIRTNLKAKNFRLVKTPEARPGVENWKEVVAHRDDVLLERFELFRNHMVVEERQAGLLRLRVISSGGQGEHYVDFGEPAYDAYSMDNYEVDTPVLRYGYTSLTTPDAVFDYNMDTRGRELVKQEEVLAGFGQSNYTTERLYAEARDGVKVPVSLVYRNDRFRKDGTNPILLEGYGSYGISEEADFSPYMVSLLDRGFVYAIAHVRGGQEMGRRWYEDGKLLKKKNTFTDFIDCAEFLIQRKYADSKRVFAMGGSAGGLLMGAVMNMRPDLWRGIYAAVPFVDVVTSMLDDTIPLTTSEYDEWGDPHQKEYYDYMLSYSPYDNVENKNYPHILIQAGLHDSQVQYWEPAKWAAKLRAMKTDDNLLLLKTELEAGHGGVSGRYKRYRERAFIFAFLLDAAGIGK